jgi:hypothetical protein
MCESAKRSRLGGPWVGVFALEGLAHVTDVIRLPAGEQKKSPRDFNTSGSIKPAAETHRYSDPRPSGSLERTQLFQRPF